MGNYLGTWQRIDIPLFIQTEYCLLVDADTVFLRSFTFAHFGLKLTKSIAMSSEFDPHDSKILNAGVSLINVPYMRQTYERFIAYILNHTNTAKFDHPSPSDQGAYLSFYKDTIEFLPQRFNFKPYWDVNGPEFKDPYILHFHGAKVHDYLKFIFGSECDEAIRFMCFRADQLPLLCEGIQAFAKHADIDSYCNKTFSETREKQMCARVLKVVNAGSKTCSGSLSHFLVGQLAIFSDDGLPTEGKTLQQSVVSNCFSEYLMVGWQLILTALSLICVLLPTVKIAIGTLMLKTQKTHPKM